MPLGERLKVAKDFLRGRKTPSRPSTPVPHAETPPAHTQMQPDAIHTQVDTPATQLASTLSSEGASLATSPGGDTSSISEPSAVTSSAKDPPTFGTKSTRMKDSVVDNVALAVDVVEKLAGFVQTVPFIAPVAGCLSQIIKVYKEMEATDEKRDNLLCRIVSISHDLHATVLRMEAAGHVDVLTRLKPDLETYAGLLEKAAAFVADYNEIGAVRRGAARNQLGGDFSTLQQDLNSFGARFRTNRLVDLSIQQNQMKGALDQVHDAVTVDKLERWLRLPPDMAQKQHDTQALRQEGTGEWFLEGNKFVYWQDHPGSLWIQGSSGAGKSVLSSAAITKLIHDKPLFQDRGKSAAVAFFYFDFNDKTDHAVERALRRIVLQLSAQSHCHYEILDAQYNLSDGQTLPTYDDLQRILEELLRQLERTYIIFDGLDECADNEQVQIITLISRLQKWTEAPLHLLFTSQPRDVFLNGFKDVTCVYVESHVMQKDIRLFVEAELRKMKTWSSRIDEIADRVVSKSNGMFRFAACILIELSRCKRQNELNRAIENLPTDLFGVYDRFIQRIRTDDFVYVAAIFRWLLFGVRSWPSINTLAALADAISFDFSNPTHHTYDPTLRNDHANTILEWLEGLVTVTADDREERHLALAHSSVQDYLLSAPFAEKFKCDLSLGPSHTFLAQSCIGGLLHFADHPFNQFISYPLAEYAAKWWCHHLLRSQDRAVLFVDAMRLVENGSEQYNALNLLRRSRNNPASPLELCAEEGYIEGVCALLENDVAMGSALHLAAFGGHVTVVHLLLEKGTNIDLHDAEHATALHVASRKGHVEIVRLLLERGAGVNIYDSQDGTALMAAVSTFYTTPEPVEIVRLLLAAGADANAHNEGDSTVLRAASWNGHVELVRLLLENGAELDAHDEEHDGTALHGAAERGHFEVVRLLLERGADPNARAERTSTALQAAAWSGNIEVVRLLLEKGADINAQGGRYGSALHGASSVFGDVELVRFLLQNGADINAYDDHFGNALQEASFWGHTDIVRLLLTNGCDPNAHAEEYASALQYAALRGRCDIIELLLANGVDVNAPGKAYHPKYLNQYLELWDLKDVPGDWEHFSVLEAACVGGHTGSVRLLVEHGADVTAYGGRALYAASWAGDDNAVKLLLDKGAAINAQVAKHGSVLCVASRQGHIKTVRLLIAHGADVNGHGGEYGNPLRAALSNDCKDDGGYVIPSRQADRDTIVTLLRASGAVETVVLEDAVARELASN
ncbi:ankyrin repeat-containing domain protein [Mycena rebaudengoi]|nr:ankyrin repeat-containing domain protein [Mycena rebaudengoi]